MNMMSTHLGESNEMYLITVLKLSRKAENGEVTVSRLAEETGHSMSTVSEKVRKLTEKGYLEHEWREGVSLSRKGHLYAGRLLRKRRLIETFLVRMAGYSIYDVHDEACRLEHVISDRLTDALDRMLDYPEVDPHGHPIPTHEGECRGVETVALSELDSGVIARVAALCSEDAERLKYMHELGFEPERQVVVREKAPFDGPITVDIEGHNIVISPALASCVQMKTREPVLLGRNGTENR
ncbi:DtxR family iron (metal) dependent repressor [Prosthecochloris sp. HL-130-GSB]|nr:DtxR family iron (metal) dependent repressor [Prosthecochloris sp. HL-130-GSB]MBO8093310.1 metal-dependent transcriptional regulator [Prosthecochloris sp.]